MPLGAASHLGLHCLVIARLGISSLQWVNLTNSTVTDFGVVHIKKRTWFSYKLEEKKHFRPNKNKLTTFFKQGPTLQVARKFPYKL